MKPPLIQQRQFVEDASHELRTPLQIIQGHLNLIKRWGKKDPTFRRVFKYFIRRNESNYKASRRLLLLTKDKVNMQSLGKRGR